METLVYELKTINSNCYWKHSLYEDGTLFSEYLKVKIIRGNCSIDTIKEKTVTLNQFQIEKFKIKNKKYFAFSQTI